MINIPRIVIQHLNSNNKYSFVSSINDSLVDIEVGKVFGISCDYELSHKEGNAIAFLVKLENNELLISHCRYVVEYFRLQASIDFINARHVIGDEYVLELLVNIGGESFSTSIDVACSLQSIPKTIDVEGYEIALLLNKFSAIVNALEFKAKNNGYISVTPTGGLVEFLDVKCKNSALTFSTKYKPNLTKSLSCKANLRYFVRVGEQLLSANISDGRFEVDLNELSVDDGSFTLDFMIESDSILVDVPIKVLCKRSKENYAPFYVSKLNSSLYYLRLTGHGTVILTQRKYTDVEQTLRFKLLESEVVQKVFKYSAAIVRRLRKRRTVLLFEKESCSSQEGVLDLTRRINRDTNTRAYFIIDDLSKLSEHEYALKKYSVKYYFHTYLAMTYISTEAPMHINILQSANRTLKRNVAHKKFVFLQHGITYMKSQTKASSFLKGKEAYPDLMVVSSEKEQKVVSRMLKIPSSRLLNTGMLIFDDLERDHLKNCKDVNLLVMFTWRPFEMDMLPEESTLYKMLQEVTSTIKSKVSQDNLNVRVCLHPKIRHLFTEEFNGYSIHDDDVSEALSWANLVITDYSSICYNSFYQGASVLFYQPDLSVFEEHVGQLIPDEHEYIGFRSFDLPGFEESLIKACDEQGILVPNKLRTIEHENNYHQINEFSDNKAKDRIINELKRRKYL
ncbi:CDP-glycerol glycerophosphotransferase family protein [Vibrio sp. SCSIO 43135]|uniref:CDP-glycerol glycerophosphotransferase family protein n=1 Tax=Vibrio sp. SCSIO 43135 TaxID=2819096 RepID=UPI0020752EFC|nr:CDP-glycerol glycerophosphotransferase family protein [Vibrio sp. SCSIO 43135]USD41335.1 CDP-glycerol glycerophosphotransferase family protein [Vibrio sp. SCSIO 43135]